MSYKKDWPKPTLYDNVRWTHLGSAYHSFFLWVYLNLIKNPILIVRLFTKHARECC